MSTIFVPLTGKTVTFREDLKTQDFSFSGNSFSLRRSFQCRWSDRFDLALGMLGFATIENKNTLFPWLSRYLPLGFQHLTDIRGINRKKPFLYPTGVDRMEGLAPTKQVDTKNLDLNTGQIGYDSFRSTNHYRRARVSFMYEAPTYQIYDDYNCPRVLFRQKVLPSEPQLLKTIPSTLVAGQTYENHFDARRWTTRIVQPLTETLRLPTGYYNFAEGFESGLLAKAKPKVAVNATTYVLHPTLEVTYVWHQVPALVQPWEDGTEWLYKDRDIGGIGIHPELIGACYTHVGCVNARWFDGFPPGSLLLTSVEARPYRWITGERYFDYTYRMKFFNPQEYFAYNEGPFVFNGDMRVKSRPQEYPYSFVGHNYYLRYKEPGKEGDQTLHIEPYFSLVTHNGESLEKGGRPIFQYRDFEDLFIPYNRSHMVQYYKKTLLAPVWKDSNGVTGGDAGT